MCTYPRGGRRSRRRWQGTEASLAKASVKRLKNAARVKHKRASSINIIDTLRLRPTTGLDRRVSRPCGTPHRVRVGLHRPLWQPPIVVYFCDGLTCYENLPK